MSLLRSIICVIFQIFSELKVQEITRISVLNSINSAQTVIGYAPGMLFEDLAKKGEADIAIVSTEEGFSPLGGSRYFLESDLGISYDKVIRPIADWNRFENERVTLIVFPSQNPESLLKGVILAPGENCKSYSAFCSPYSKKPHRDYYYNVCYESIHFACRVLHAKKIAISHLSSSNKFHEDMTTCQVEALTHFCNANKCYEPESFTYCFCCIDQKHLQGIRKIESFIHEKHRSIKTEIETIVMATLIHIDWKSNEFEREQNLFSST